MMRTRCPLPRKTLTPLVTELHSRREVAVRLIETLRAEATEALATRDVSDLLDEDTVPSDEPRCDLMLAEVLEEGVTQIDDALERVATGSYGFCEDCGERIPVVRLRALPATATCVTCQRMRRHQLVPRRSIAV